MPHVAAWSAALIGLGLSCAVPPLKAEPLIARGPDLGAASNFGEGVQEALLQAALALPVRQFRDGISWERAETQPGAYAFGDKRLDYPDRIFAGGGGLTLTVNWGNSLYDQGDTPQSAGALAAMADFVLAAANRFPGIEAVEIGNEVNSANFVRGPLKAEGADARAKAHTAMLLALGPALRASHPDIRILGGSSHSIAAGYLWTVLDLAGAGAMDALAIHPYTTPPEQLQRQIAVLRRHPLAASLPIEVTEFGTPDAAAAPGHFLRNYCQFALSGVTRADWYPLGPRADGYAPLIDAQGPTPVGQAWLFAATHFAGQPVTDAAPDPFTYGCAFGTSYLVLWGAPRALSPAPGVTLLDAQGQPLPADQAIAPALSPDQPLILYRPAGIELARDAGLAPQMLVADSFDQFAYPLAEEFQAGADAFERFARRGADEIALVTLPGQERPGMPWTPYRGMAGGAAARLGAETLLPGVSGRGEPIEIVHRFTAPAPMRLVLSGKVAPAEASADGVAVWVTLDGKRLLDLSGKDPMQLDLGPIDMPQGARLEIAVGPGAAGDAAGDVAAYRFTLRRAD